jgi:uncharacterized protein involved in exopolysaccharide biosynthesis
MKEEVIVFEDEFNIYNLLRRLWKDRILFIAIVSLFAIGSIIYSLVVKHQYEVTASILPADASRETTIKDTSPVMGFAMTGYSHLPVINGIMITLGSDSFLELIYEKYKNEDKLFDDKLKIIDESEDSEDQKNLLKRHEALRALRKILKFRVNSDHNTILLSVKLNDKYFAYELMNFIIDSLRSYTREQNISNLESDIAFYQQILEKASDPRIQQMIDRKLTEKLERKFVLSSNVFTIVDMPVVPAKRIFPKRSMIVILTSVFGGFIGLALVSFRLTALKIFKIITQK